MKDRILELAKDAGFCFWSNESHKPKAAVIDWSCEYDKELEKFYYLAKADNKEFDEMSYVINKQASYIEHLEQCLLGFDNNFEVSDEAYRSWRRREAYQIPVSEEGQKKAIERLTEFNKGFIAGVNASCLALERMHSQAKNQHKFYLFAQNAVQGLTYKPPVS